MPNSMSTRPADRLWGGKRRVVAALIAGLVLASLQGCGLFADDAPEASSQVAPADVAPQLQAVLDARAAALRDHREQTFLATVDVSDRTLRARERRFFANLSQLPIARLDYELVLSSLVDTGSGVTAVVRRRLQLTPYDALPVVTPDRVSFAVVDGRYVIAGDHDRAWQKANDIEVPPWDTTSIEVRTAPGVLGVFDRESVADADAVLADVQQGLADVGALVPGDWARGVVVYALSDVTAFREIDDLPGGDPEHLDAVAFPVQSAPWSRHLASTRVVLHPRMLHESSPARQRLIRHELTHVALGMHDDRVPVWLSEGLAEWVSVQPIPVAERLISADAVTAAIAGINDLPSSDQFNGADAGANYGLAWWACEVIAAEHGSAMLWQLLDAMAEGDGTTEAEQGEVLKRLVGLNAHQLARRAARRIVATFG